MERSLKMRLAPFAAAVVAMTFGSSSIAQAETHRGFAYAPEARPNAKCFLSVKGRTYINGPCVFTPRGKGSFDFSDNKTRTYCYHRQNDCAMAELKIEHDGYFGSLDVSPSGSGDAYWNEGEGLHGQAHLGELRRTGACWLSDPAGRRVKLCVWR